MFKNVFGYKYCSFLNTLVFKSSNYSTHLNDRNLEDLLL